MHNSLETFTHELAVPLLSRLMVDRRLGWAVLGAAGLQGTLVTLGLPGWPCLFRHSLGLPCPGCGLSRAAVALLQGDWETALAYHAFVPLVLLTLGLIVGSSLLPERARQKLLSRIGGLERRLLPAPLTLAAMLIYWLARLVFYHSTYLPLIMS